MRGSILFFLSSLRAARGGVVLNALEEVDGREEDGRVDLMRGVVEERERERRAERRNGALGWRGGISGCIRV